MSLEEPKWSAVYLTGAPATGKSTLTKKLAKEVANVEAFIYGEEITAFVRARHGAGFVSGEFDHASLRELSANVVTPADVAEVDQMLAKKLSHRSSHLIVDSHAVTKERFGYRVTPFEASEFRSLGFTHIVCLYTDAPEAVRRIKGDAQGRPVPTPFQADLHTFLQASAALNYSIQSGLPLHFLDSTAPTEELVKFLTDLISAR